MPRIRSIKPEFWTSGQVLECSRNARLLFIGLWNFCDDKGRHPLRPKQIKAEVFPADELTPDDILGMLTELSENGLISTYAVDSQEYLQVVGWHHQRIDKPQPAKHPEPLQDDSANTLGTLPPDRKGYDGSGKDGTGKDKGAPDGAPPKPKKNDVQKPDDIDEQVWSDFLAHRRQKKAKLTPTAWKAIRKQLDIGADKGHDPNDMLAVAMAAGWQGFEFDWYLNRIGKKGGVAQQAVEYRRQRQRIVPEEAQ